MIGSAINAVRSCYSPDLYHFAAYERLGIGLTFLFGIACILLCIGYGIGLEYMGTPFFDMLLSVARAGLPGSGFAFPDYPYVGLFLLHLVFLWTVTMTMLNIAVFFAMLGTVIVFFSKMHLEYEQLLRIAVYAEIAGLVVTTLVEIAFLKAGVAPPPVMGYVLFALILAYLCYGIYCAR